MVDAQAKTEKLIRLQTELQETESLLQLPSVQGNVRQVLENLRGDLEKQIAELDLLLRA